MNDTEIGRPPAALERIRHDSAAIGFALASEPQTGSLLRTLAAAKPGGRFLELGTGTGIGTAWLLDGMDAAARLDSVDADAAVLAVARRNLGRDTRVNFHHADGGEFLSAGRSACYDFIFADTWSGKYTHLELALAALRPGGLYVIDDLLPQATWPPGHAEKVPPLVDRLERDDRLVTTKLAWASGLMIVARR